MLKAAMIVCLSIAMQGENAWPMPQDMSDIKTGALMAMGQIKDVIDNGAAVKADQQIQLMGAKMGGNFEMGIGDAIKRNRRDMPYNLHKDNVTDLYVMDDDTAENGNETENTVSGKSTSSSSSSSSSSAVMVE